MSKTIIHPGEVNRIRELPQNSKIVATHTDNPGVLTWDVDSQPNRHAVLGAAESRPDLILTGHKENAEFALGMCPAEPFVLSGGKDKLVVLWSIHDHISALGEASKSPAASPGGSGGKQAKAGSDKSSEGTKVAARGVFQGHSDTVEDVQFAPSSSQEFCSVGDDACIILWDARVGSSPVVKTDGSVPNTLVVANCEIVKPRVAATEHISQFNEEARSPFVKKSKTIIHPGEVNRIRELPQNSKIVATHTDGPDVLIWDVDAQPNRRAVLGIVESRPDLILTGHKENAEFTLGMCPAEPFVLSGGKDKLVVLWSIHDHISALGEATKSPAASSGASGGKQSAKAGSDKTSESPKVAARGVFQGHSDTVEDVQFAPSSSQEFCSVGDDACVILWDARVGSSPVIKVEKAHQSDVHCVDWNRHDENLILTGSADNSVRMFDRRNLISGGVGSPVHKFEAHSAAVLCVQWCPNKASVFGSSAEDGFLNIWDHEKVGKKKERASTRTAANSNPGLFFQHAGHRDKVVDFHWNASDPWTIVSVSDDCESTGGGGTLQIWRMSDLIYRPEDEVLEELEKFKSHILSCKA